MREGRTFAERAERAERAAQIPKEPRLVSLGPSEYAQRNKHGGYDLIPAELFVDYDRPSRFYAKLPGYDTLVPLNGDDKRRDTVVKLPPLPNGRRRFSKPDTGRPASPPDPPPVKISGADNPLYTPNP